MKFLLLKLLLLIIVCSCDVRKEPLQFSDSAAKMFAQYQLALDYHEGSNVLINGEFEASREPWVDRGNSKIVSGQGIQSSTAMGIFGKGGFAQSIESLDHTKSYTLHFQAMLTHGSLKAEGGIHFYDANRNLISSQTVAVDSKFYKDYTLQLSIPSNAAYAEVYGQQDNARTSKPVYFDNFMLAAENKLPVVSLGEDKTLTLPTDSITINSQASDDDGIIAYYLWSKVSGPSAGMMSGNYTANLSLSGLIAGEYIFSLTVTDDQQGTATDSIKIVVNPEPTTPTPPPTPAPTNYLINPGFEMGLAPWGNWEGSSVVSGQGINGSAAIQVMGPGGFSQAVENLDLSKKYLLSFHTKKDSSAIFAEGGVQFYDASWVSISSIPTVLDSVAYKQYNISFTIPANTKYVMAYGYNSDPGNVYFDNFVLSEDGSAPPPEPTPNKLPTVSAGADREITLPTNSLSITATAADEDGTIASYQWSKVSGPVAGTMAGITTATLNLSNLAEGDYVYSVTVKDNVQASASASVRVKVNPNPTVPAPNNLLLNAGFEMGLAPWGNWNGSSVVSGQGINGSAAIRVIGQGGFSQYIENFDLSKKYLLSFQAKKDSLAIYAKGGVEFYDASWITISSIPVELDSVPYKQYNLSFSIPANTKYVTAFGYSSDPGNVYFDNFVLSEDGSAPVPTPNKIPTVSAGADREITLPTNSLSISASAADADGSIASYQWTKVSGPVAGTMAGTTAATLNLSNLAEGDYVYSVTVKDNLQASASDSVSVKVHPNPTSTPPPTQSTDPVAVITGAKYYVSTTDGDDTRTSLQAQNPSTPWKTIAKVNSFQSNLKPGDGVLFKRGDVFFGTLILQVSGTNTSPIQFSSYGSGERPVLTTFKSLTSWTQVATGIYEASYTGSVSALNLLAINGKSYAFGRYPKLTDPNNGYLKTQTGSNETTIQDSSLPSGINWTGAEVVVRKTPWVNDRISVRSQSGTTLSLLKNTALFTQSGNGSGYSMKAGQEYFLQNHMATLKSFGDWAYDPLTKKVKVFFGSNSPSNYKVEVPHADNLIQINYSNNLAFSAINFIGSGKNSFYVYVSSHISIIYSKIQFSGFFALYGELAEYFKFENSEILDSQSNGFSISNSGTGFIGRDNIIRRTGIFHGMSGSGDGHGFALNVSSVNNVNTTIERNQIYQTGYVGIAFNGSNAIVRKNLIDTYCMIKSDGGGIYTYNGANKDFVNITVSDNIITNSADLMVGIPNDAIGIYIDDNGNNVNISNNSVSNTGAGIYLHNTWDIVVSNNISSNNHTQFQISNDNYGSRPMKNMLIQSNIFIAKENSQHMLTLVAIREPISAFGNFTNNRYITPFDNTMIIRTWNPSWISTDISFEEWKQIYQKDLDSRLESLRLSNSQGEDLIFVYNASPATKSFSNYSSFFNVLTGQTVAGDLSVAPYRSAVLVGVP